jgi:hypothetical protein
MLRSKLLESYTGQDGPYEAQGHRHRDKKYEDDEERSDRIKTPKPKGRVRNPEPGNNCDYQGGIRQNHYTAIPKPMYWSNGLPKYQTHKGSNVKCKMKRNCACGNKRDCGRRVASPK